MIRRKTRKTAKGTAKGGKPERVDLKKGKKVYYIYKRACSPFLSSALFFLFSLSGKQKSLSFLSRHRMIAFLLLSSSFPGPFVILDEPIDSVFLPFVVKNMNSDDITTVVTYTTLCGKCRKREANPYMTMPPFGRVCYLCFTGHDHQRQTASAGPQRTFDDIYEN